MTEETTNLKFITADCAAIEAGFDALVIAGWTGRNQAAMEAHIVELEKMGVKRPASTPIFYRAATQLLTQSGRIEVIGDNSSGEVEPVIFSLSNGLWLGVGSDHTDRKAEAIGVSISKQLCPKPVGKTIWRLEEVADHWDDLIVRSFATRNGSRRLYQEGPLAAMRTPTDLMTRYDAAPLPVGTAMFCGTLAVHGEIGPAEEFEIEIEDPVRRRRMSHRYSILTLADHG